ncbi:MAG: MFS transporter [Phenylobacterium sp.]|uniref:peptide MFS transporter n=1 Tax=Phenylobacterium sp. TaxID=1871053 RepID=UPI0025E85A8A|nr:peptide MFS transporter [Phenylobacterium sp.]MBI1198040.1 MFS transporter [Phenylobacterium sp.]
MTTKIADKGDTAFFGHPKALGYLAFTEAWERFSYYGMNTLLVLYMTRQLLLPGHVDNVVGFPFVRDLFDPGHTLSPQALAALIGGTYGALVYLTPLLGGLLADWVLGRTPTIIMGALLMAAGHFLMAFEQPFFLALICLMLGSGCFKGNIASQVGSLYKEGDNRRADAFQVFYLGINAGVIAAPLVTGTLAENVAWHWGFGAAGVGMLISIVIYMAGRKGFPSDPPLRKRAEMHVERPAMTRSDWIRVAMLFALVPVMAASIVGNQQIFIVYQVWAQQSVDLHLFGKPMLTEWLISVDSIVSVSCLAGMVIFWRLWAKRFKEPDEFGKIIIGCAFGAAGVACLGLGTILTPAGAKVPFFWLLLFHLLNDIGFANVLPVGLALFARAAPQAISGAVIGIYYLHLFIGNAFTGWLGSLLEKMPAADFWLMHAALVGGAGVVFLVIAPFFRRVLAPEPQAALAAA